MSAAVVTGAGDGAVGGAAAGVVAAASALFAGVFKTVAKFRVSFFSFSLHGCWTAKPIMTMIIAAKAAQRSPKAHDRGWGLRTTCSSSFCN
jgi:hypothetical protein